MLAQLIPPCSSSLRELTSRWKLSASLSLMERYQYFKVLLWRRRRWQWWWGSWWGRKSRLKMICWWRWPRGGVGDDDDDVDDDDWDIDSWRIDGCCTYFQSATLLAFLNTIINCYYSMPWSVPLPFSPIPILSAAASSSSSPPPPPQSST